ncbi:kinesin-domain-containing protein [Linderina pennispora]|uniref:Kinesin-like protein n=1 Tax=Linderina pennispora TaxID=61395 RepID=A0A1Y1WLK7_9FUNG|nr:kinesin-domain-containing protein [Linderina pennispora]ORX73964.1 kinesin-domain-containing protein [Linderina pennispora]
MSQQDNNIKVIARFRPPNALEKKSGSTSVIEIEDESTVALKCEEHTGSFAFDKVFGSDTTQSQIYNYAISDTLEDIFNGYNGTVFCYGQTGSGKTFTMMGADIDNDDLKGIIPRIVEGIFAKIIESPPTVEYMDKTNGVYVKGLMEVFVSSIDEVYQVMRQGSKNRVVAYTNMNAESSRSHSIFQISIEQKDTVSGKTKMGRLFLVDLAGSEKVGKTGATGQTLEEAKKINKSLSALGMVINALTDGKSSHIPYRDSKLTRILQESLGGNSRTTLIINCSPMSFNAAETVSTLRFGMRAKSIKNKAKINQEFSPAELKAMLKKARSQAVSFQTYISALEGEVKIWRTGGSDAKALPAAPQRTHTAGGRGTGASTPRSAARHSVSAGVGNSAMPLSPTPTATRVGSPTPTLQLNDSLLSELGSRSGSPTTVMSEDEREERNTACKDTRKENETMREQLDFLKSETEAAQLKLELDKVSFSQKEAEITVDSLTEANNELTEQLNKVREEIEKLKVQADQEVSAADKEKLREARVAAMINDMDSAKAISRHEAGMGDLLRALVEAGDDDSKKVELLTKMRKDVDEMNDLLQERERTGDLAHQCEDTDGKYERLLTDYEEMIEQSIAAEEQQNSRDTETINELKQKLEAHYTNKLNTQKAQLESTLSDLQRRHEEVAKLNASIREMRSENRDLLARVEALAEEKTKAETALASAQKTGSSAIGVADSSSEREMQAMRRDMAQRILEYDTMRKSLMRDVQNRCEKIIELEMALDESREQVSQLSHKLGNMSQPQRMSLLEKNVAELTAMQKRLVEQNAELKKRDALAERKLDARQTRIKCLEEHLESTNRQAEAWKRKTEELKNLLSLEASRPAANAAKQPSAPGSPMRGGGGSQQPAAVEEKVSTGRTSGGFFSWGGN